MTLGALIRLLIVAAWLALFTRHLVSHAAPGLGLAAGHDLGAVLRANLGREFLYDLVQESRTAAPRQLGSSRLAFAREERGYQLETALELNDPGQLAALALLLKGGAGAPRRITLRIVQHLDQELRLVALNADGAFFGTAFSAEGTVDEHGISGSWRLEDGPATPLAVPGIGSDDNQGMDLVITLPPGLKTGDRFASRLLSPDVANLRLVAKTAVFTALGLETVATRAGERALLAVGMSVDGRAVASLWCDEHGTVYRTRQAGGPTLLLRQVREVGGDILWPADGPPPR
jgi:hypothetical protein